MKTLKHKNNFKTGPSLFNQKLYYHEDLIKDGNPYSKTPWSLFWHSLLNDPEIVIALLTKSENLLNQITEQYSKYISNE